MAATLNLEVASLSVATLAVLEVDCFPLAALEVAMASLESGSRKLRSSGIRKSEELSGDPDIGI